MRGSERPQGAMWSYDTLEQRIPEDHPLRPIRQMVDRAPAEMSPEFDRLYSKTRRPSISLAVTRPSSWRSWRVG